MQGAREWAEIGAGCPGASRADPSLLVGGGVQGDWAQCRAGKGRGPPMTQAGPSPRRTGPLAQRLASLTATSMAMPWCCPSPRLSRCSRRGCSRGQGEGDGDHITGRAAAGVAGGWPCRLSFV